MVQAGGGLAPGSGVYAGVVVSGEQYQFLVGGVGRGLSSNAILNSMAGTDLAIRRQAGLEALREIRGSVGSGDAINATPYSLYPSEGVFQVSGHQLNSEHYVWASVEATVVATGETRTLNGIAEYDGQLSHQQIQEMVAEQLQSAAEIYGLQFATAAIKATRALRAGPAGVFS